MKSISKRDTPSNYLQPVDNFSGRLVNESQEKVDYIPDSHIRIWYNNVIESYPLHHHGAVEIIMCEENNYQVIVNDQKYLLNVGDVLIIPPHMLHEIICDKEGARFIFLINLDLLSDYHDYKTLNPLFMSPYLCNAKTRPEIYQQIYSTLKQMVSIYFSNDIFWESSIYSLLLKILVIIGQDHFSSIHNDTSSMPSANKQREHYEKFANLLNYIDANYTEELTLEQAADFIGFSKFHFTRLFKQYTNTTFYDYLCHKRIQAAQSLLTMDIPITDIAFQTGFNNLTTFCRCFKKCTNCSPTEYRNKFREE